MYMYGKNDYLQLLYCENHLVLNRPAHPFL